MIKMALRRVTLRYIEGSAPLRYGSRRREPASFITAKIEFYLICARFNCHPDQSSTSVVAEVAMRIFVAVFAALLTLGLVAFRVVVAQKDTGSAPVTASAAPVSYSQNRVAAAGGEKAPQQLAETTNTPAPFASAAVVQNNTTAVAPAFPPPTVAPKPVAACNNPDALGLSRLIEIDTTSGPAFGTQHFKQ